MRVIFLRAMKSHTDQSNSFDRRDTCSRKRGWQYQLANQVGTATNMLLSFVCVSVLVATGFAHEPLTPAQIAQMKQEGTFEERMQRARRLSPEKISAGLGPTVVYKLRKEALRASGMPPAEISRALCGGRAMAFPYSAQPELKASGTVKTFDGAG